MEINNISEWHFGVVEREEDASSRFAASIYQKARDPAQLALAAEQNTRLLQTERFSMSKTMFTQLRNQHYFALLFMYLF